MEQHASIQGIPEFAAAIVDRLASRGTTRRTARHRSGKRRSTVCSGCGKPRDRGRSQSYCRRCHNEYARTHRPKQVELSAEAKRRANVRAHTKMLVKRGQLTKTPCACGAIEVTAVHQPDYADPRAVTWQCKECRSGRRREAAA